MAEAQVRRQGWRVVPILWLLACLFLLNSCMLISGEQTTISLQEGAANILTTFVSAEGSNEYRLPVMPANSEAQAIVMIAVESGDVQIELVQPDGAIALVLASRPGAQVTRSGSIRSDEQGRIRYRLSARSARNGEIQIFVLP